MVEQNKKEIILLTQKEIWDGIVDEYATDEEILMFLDAYEESAGYEILSDEARSQYVIFKMLVTEELGNSEPSSLLYHYVQDFLYGYSCNLDD